MAGIFARAGFSALGPFLFFAAVLGSSATAVAQSNPYARFGGTADANGAPILPPSQIVGATAGNAGVGASGSANYTVPITVPAGTTGVQPNLTLQFVWPGGNGVVGYGGSIGGISSISRCPLDLYNDGTIDPVDYDANDQFCLNGQRLLAVSGTYGANGTEYRTKIEEFSKVVSYGSVGGGPQSFRVWRKSGEILEYGMTADSRVEVLGGTAVRVWALNKLSDRLGNYVLYVYSENTTTGEHVLDRVDYTGNDGQGLTPFNSVDFVYEPRAAGAERRYFLNGQVYLETQRLKNVRVLADTTLVRDYKLTYAGSQVTSIL